MLSKNTNDKKSSTISSFLSFRRNKKIIADVEDAPTTNQVDISGIEKDSPRELHAEWQNKINELVEGTNMLGKGTPLIGAFSNKTQNIIISILFISGLFLCGLGGYYFAENKKDTVRVETQVEHIRKDANMAMLAMENVSKKENDKLTIAQNSLSSANQGYNEFYLTISKFDQPTVQSLMVGYQRLGQKIAWLNDAYTKISSVDPKSFSNAVAAVSKLLNADIDDINSTLINSELSTKYYPIIFLCSGLFAIIISIWLFVMMNLAIRFNEKVKSDHEKNREEYEVIPLLNDLNKISKGNLKVKLQPSGKLLGVIAGGVNILVDNIGKIARSIKYNSSQVKERMNEIEIVSEKLKISTDEQQKLVNKIETSINEVSNLVDRTSKKTSASKLLVNDANKTSIASVNEIQNLAKIMRNIEEKSDQTYSSMVRVESMSKSISEVADLLYEINEETSVLAHNATIQSSKAGQMGKGFQIISSSIQELSNKALAATKRVEELATVIQENIDEADSFLKEAMTEVKNGVMLSEATGISLTRLKNNIANLNNNVEDMFDDSKKQIELSLDINKDIVVLKQSNNKNKENVSQTNGAISKVTEAAKNMEKSIEQFTL